MDTDNDTAEAKNTKEKKEFPARDDSLWVAGMKETRQRLMADGRAALKVK